VHVVADVAQAVNLHRNLQLRLAFASGDRRYAEARLELAAYF
jgi:hypothetical protein